MGSELLVELGRVRREPKGGQRSMEHVRGFLMIAAAAIAFWKAWMLHAGPQFWLACGLGVLALSMAVWHFRRKGQSRLRR
jgi:hypothetical protein